VITPHSFLSLYRVSLGKYNAVVEYMGDIIGDISSRRGRIEGNDIFNGTASIRGFVPLSEMFGYATDLRSKTQGRGVYVMQMDHFEQMPSNLAEKVSK